MFASFKSIDAYWGKMYPNSADKKNFFPTNKMQTAN